MNRLPLILAILVAFAGGSRASEVIQVDVRAILNARSVTTLTDGRVVPWTVGVDGGGAADGYMTREASVFQGDKDPRALPGDGCFAATALHPAVRLNFSNADGKGGQTRAIAGAAEFGFPVPAARYARMLLFLTSAEGPSHLAVALTYADGTEDKREFLLPDYYNDAPPHDPDVFPLASNLATGNSIGRMAEADHHFIHGLDVHPDPGKVLRHVKVGKTADAYLVFWGATGVTAD